MKNDNFCTLVSEQEKIEIAKILFVENNYFKSPIKIETAREKLKFFCAKKRLYVNFLLNSLIQSEFLRKIDSENLELGNAIEVDHLLCKETFLLSEGEILLLLRNLESQLGTSSVDSKNFTLKIKEFLNSLDTKSEHDEAVNNIREDLMNMKYIEEVCDGLYKLTQVALDLIKPSNSSRFLSIIM